MMPAMTAFLCTLPGSHMLAYVPFIDPLPMDRFWLLLLLPLVLAIGIVYKTTKLDDLSRLPREALVFAGQILAFMFAAGLILALVTALA